MAWRWDGRERWHVCTDSRAHFVIAAGPGAYDFLCGASEPDVLRPYQVAPDVHGVPLCGRCIGHLATYRDESNTEDEQGGDDGKGET